MAGGDPLSGQALSIEGLIIEVYGISEILCNVKDFWISKSIALCEISDDFCGFLQSYLCGISSYIFLDFTWVSEDL